MERKIQMDIDALMDAKFGEVGSEERIRFRKEAYEYCIGQLINNKTGNLRGNIL